MPSIDAEICPQKVQQEGPPPEKVYAKLDVEIAYCLSGIPPPKQVYAKLSAQLTLQVYESPIAPKASHVMEVMGSHSHPPINNVEGVGSVPPPLSQSLH